MGIAFMLQKKFHITKFLTWEYY